MLVSTFQTFRAYSARAACLRLCSATFTLQHVAMWSTCKTEIEMAGLKQGQLGQLGQLHLCPFSIVTLVQFIQTWKIVLGSKRFLCNVRRRSWSDFAVPPCSACCYDGSDVADRHFEEPVFCMLMKPKFLKNVQLQCRISSAHNFQVMQCSEGFGFKTLSFFYVIPCFWRFKLAVLNLRKTHYRKYCTKQTSLYK